MKPFGSRVGLLSKFRPFSPPYIPELFAELYEVGLSHVQSSMAMNLRGRDDVRDLSSDVRFNVRSYTAWATMRGYCM